MSSDLKTLKMFSSENVTKSIIDVTDLSRKEEMFDIVFTFVLWRLKMFQPRAVLGRIQETPDPGRRD